MEWDVNYVRFTGYGKKIHSLDYIVNSGQATKLQKLHYELLVKIFTKQRTNQCY